MTCAADGSRSVPPTGSAATGWATFVVDDATRHIDVHAHVEGGSSITGIELRDSTSTLLALSPASADSWTGAATLSFAQFAALDSEQARLVFVSAAHPSGEIAGPVRQSRTELFSCIATGAAAFPPNVWGPDAHMSLVLHTPDNILLLSHDGVYPQPATISVRLGSSTTQNGTVIASHCCLNPFVNLQVGPLSASTLAALRAGDTYVRIDTPRAPTGEVRGQIEPAVLDRPLSGAIDGAQAVPPGSPAITGHAAVRASTGSRVVVQLQARSAQQPTATLHIAPPGQVGPAVASISFVGIRPTNEWAFESSVSLTPAQVVSARLGHLYVQLSAPGQPAATGRGQLLPHPRPATIGRGCRNAAGDRARLAAPTPFVLTGSLALAGYGFPANSVATLHLGGPTATRHPIDLAVIGMRHCHLAVTPIGLELTVPTFPDGGLSVFMTVPLAPPLLGLELFVQGIAIDPGANALGVITSNALATAFR